MDGDRGAYIIYTSGTTGTPKGVLISHKAFAVAVATTSRAVGLGPQSRTLCVSPFHFDGSFATLFAGLSSGGTVVIRPREALLFPRAFFQAVANEQITYTGFSPSYLRLLLSSPQMAQLGRSSLECLGLGGEAASLADIRAFWEAAPQVRVFNRYGPTETTIVVTHQPLTPETTARGEIPIGFPHPGSDFFLFDEDDHEVMEAGTVGELYIGGDQLMMGYWGAPELTARALRTDLVPGRTVYRTGDLMFRDATGNYFYLGRSDAVIKRRGVRISLVELSEEVRNLEGVSAATCVLFDNEGDTGLAAFAVSDGRDTPLELRDRLTERLPETMLPDRVVLVESLPLTASGKVDQRRLLAEAGLGGLRTAGPAPTSTQAEGPA
jgi:acyl-coenzyme A synthetase/AMP-(fatty) acid ligase